MSSQQYSCLQGLRGIAIILVIIFHLFPNSFKNGFVGVDMFFVLSGFLMTKIMDRNLSISGILMFYEKRFKRILPLYFITILLTTFGVLTFVIRPERLDFIEDLKWSLLLILNYKTIFEHQSYWDQISKFRYLTHLWSLCVELQYYLIVPIIHFISANLPFNLRVITHAITIAISCLFQYQTPFELSYSFLFARVWQFLLGSLTYELSKTETKSSDLEKGKDANSQENQENEKISIFGNTKLTVFTIVFLVSVCSIMEFPSLFNEPLTRIISSLLVVYICANRETLEISFLASKPLTFVGDISFVLYLVHWPVIKLIQYTQINESGSSTPLQALLAIVITISFSLFLHFTLEVTNFFILTIYFRIEFIFNFKFSQKKLIQHDLIISFATVVLCAGLTVSAISWLKTDECWMQHTLSKDLQKQIVWNFNSSNMFKKFEDFPCDKLKVNIQRNTTLVEEEVNYCRVMSKGVGKVLVIGNSLALRAFPYLIEKFDGNYEELRLFSRTASAPLLNIVPYYTEECQEMVKWYQPDLLWIIQGVNEIDPSIASKKLPSDKSLLRGIMQNVLDKMKENAKLIYIDLPYYVSSKNTINNIAKSLIYGHDLEQVAGHTFKEVDDQIGLQSLRLQSLNCSNCFYNNLNKVLIGNDSKLYDYERSTYRPIVYDGGHLSWTGLGHLDRLYQNVINHFNNYVNHNTKSSITR